MGIKSLLVASISFMVFSANATEYIVKYKDQQTFNKMFNSIKSANSGEITEVHHTGQLARFDVVDQFAQSEKSRLEKMEGVEYVIENYQVRIFKANYTPLVTLREQYANVITKAVDAWEAAGNRGSRDVKVAVIDTGADYNHESLRDNMLPGYDFAENDDDPMDKTSFQNPGHGTHCSGSVGSTGTVSGGTQGASPMVSIIPVRFLNENGGGDLMNAVKAIDFAIEQGAHIMSNSWGAEVSADQAQPITEAIERAREAGIVFVAAAANSSKNNDSANFYPTNTPLSNVISVAATDANDSLASFSNYGVHKVDIGAPGVDIISTTPGNKYQNLSGTSMATPFVSGAIAFLMAQDMGLTPEEIEALIQATGDPIEGLQVACGCRINVLNAFTAIKENTPYFVPTTTYVNPGETQSFYVKNMDVVEYTSSNTAAATIDADGLLTAVANGETTLTAKDAAGNTVSSLTIRISDLSDVPDNGGGSCPFDPAMCAIICPIAPELCQ
jgi:thermitase